MGYWQGVIDPQAQTLDFVRLREGNFHLNALGFLEPPPLLNLTLESLEFNGNLLTADIGLRHPFLGLTEFSGFDVCGIFISGGSVSGFTDTDLVMTGEGDTRLLNPDGYSRWWNPSEFPYDSTIFGYTDGLLGAPDSVADFNTTLNGYKYYCDDLDDIGDTLDDVDINNRGLFSAGQKNVRRFEMEIGTAGLVFNYAVDACWQFPESDPPWTAPDDFAIEANRVEAWHVTVTELENTLFNDGSESGGALSLSIDVYDWFNADMNTVRVESPGNFTMTESATAIGGGVGYSTYEVDITGATPAEGSIDLLVSIVSEEENWGEFITGVNTTAYFTHSADVSTETQAAVSFEFVDEVQLFNNTTWDEFSPTIWQDATGRLIAFWHADTPTISADIPGRSYDGISWSGGTNVFGTSAPFHRFDVLKTAPRASSGCFVLINFVYPNLVACATDNGAMGGTYVFGFPGRSWNLEMMVDASGYGYGCGDAGGNIVFQKTPTPNTPGNSVAHSIAPGRLSHVRSWGLDSDGLLYLAFLDTGLSKIQLTHGTDTGNLTWTSPITVFEDSGYDDVRDPSVHLVDDVIHLSFLRHNLSTSEYELCYTYADVSDLNFSTPVVADTHTVSIEDAHVQAGTYFDASVVAIAYQRGDSLYFVYSSDGGATWETPILAQTVYSPTEDCDMVFLEHTGSLTEDVIIIWSQGGTAYRNIITRMGHFVED